MHATGPSSGIRAIVREDTSALKDVLDATGLFPAELLDDMLAGHLGDAEVEEIWLTVDDGGPMALAYCVPERMTAGTWNLLAIAVHPDAQEQGRGAALLTHIEEALATSGERLLLVETSGLPEFERTRGFYRGRGYHEEARIRDFYDVGDDKVVYRKVLGASRATAA